MRRLLGLVVALAALVGVSGGASAGQPALELSPLMLLPDPDTVIGEQVVAKRGGPFLTARLRFEETATLRRPRSVNVQGLYFFTGRNDFLRAAEVADPGFYGLSEASRVYCRMRRRLTEVERQQRVTVKGHSKLVKAFDAVVTLCFIDQDGSGRFTRAFVDGAAHPGAERAVEIEPVEYARGSRQHPWNGAVAIVVAQPPSPKDFYIEVVTNISSGRFDRTLLEYRRTDGSSGKFERGRRARIEDLPLTLSYQDARITLLAFDHISSSLTYRIDKPLTSAQTELLVFDEDGDGAVIFD